MEIYKDLESKKFLNFIETDWENNTFLHYTGNMYGLGCVAFSKEAVDRINHLKQRQRNKGFIVLIPDQEWLDIYKLSFQPRARILMQHYWPGNVTMVMKDTEKYFENVSYRGSVAVRIPSSNFLKDFLYRIKKPVISTSVNISGEIPLVRLDDIMKQRSDWFDFAVLPPLIEDVPSLPSTIIDISTNNITFLREGSISFADIRMAYDHPLILFVCTGNVCRSPMAEYYARSQIIFRGLPYEVASAGFLDKEVRISPYSYEVLKEMGIDASGHLSQTLNTRMIGDSWLILTMENMHKKSILELEPNANKKVFTLSEFCGAQFCIPSCDIEDPYGLEIFFYRDAFKRIRERVDILIDKLTREVM